jgi:hypothetical protein
MERRRRVIGFAVEGLVIVASILLAFAVDALWDQRQERERMLEYLTALEGEFLAARDEIIEQIGDHRAQLAAVDELLVGLAAGESEEFLSTRLGRLNAQYVYGPAHPVFEDLANAGAVNVLESAELRFALLRYGQSREFLAALAGREAELWHGYMHPYLIERTDLLPQTFEQDRAGLEPRFPSGIDTLYDDRTFQNLLLRRKRTIVGQLRLDQDVHEAVEAVLEQVRAKR